MQRTTQTKAILELIASRGIRQTFLAKQLGYTPAYFNHIIHHRKLTRDGRPAKLDPYKAPVLARHLRADVATILKLFGLSARYIKILSDPTEVII